MKGSFNDYLAERIWGGRDSSLDAEDCAETRADRFAPAGSTIGTSGGTMRPDKVNGATKEKSGPSSAMDQGRPI